MAKAVHWKVPFVSRKGTSYRVDIYDTYTGSVPSSWPVTLQAGETPFETEGDNSTDFFSPLRGQTGVLQVIDVDGSLMDQIVPANNVDRMVQLLQIVNQNSVVKWQGFLSCEAYSQEYTGTAKILSLRINSMLSALDSVRIGTSDDITTIKSAIIAGLHKLDYITGHILFDYIHFPKVNYGILNKYVSESVFFDLKEQDNENSVTYIEDGKSFKSIFEIICKFMGWCAMDYECSIYFMPIGHNPHDNLDMVFEDYATFISSSTISSPTETSIVTVNMSSLSWSGINHNKSISQGAKSVEVVSAVEPISCDIQLPEYPGGSYVEFQFGTYNEDYEYNFFWYVISSNLESYSNVSFHFFKAYYTTRYGQATLNGTSTFANMANVTNFTNFEHYCDEEVIFSQFTVHSGAAFTMREHKSGGVTPSRTYKYEKGLQIVYIFKPSSMVTGTSFDISTIYPRTVKSGYLHLNANVDHLYSYPEYPEGEESHTEGRIGYTDNVENDNEFVAYFELQIGTKYWNGSTWQNSRCYFPAFFKGNNIQNNWDVSMKVEQKDGLFIPVNGVMQGIVTLRLYAISNNLYTSTKFLSSSFYKSLELSYAEKQDISKNNRTKNGYFRIINANFADEVSTNNDLASDNGNIQSSSVLRNSLASDDPMSKMNYILNDDTTIERRPEVDLLDRMASYYSYARRKLELEAEHPTAAALPMLTITGYDNKTYIPIAESRNWQEDTATLTLMESPE